MRQIDLRKPEAIDLFVNSICYTAMNGPGLDGLFIDAIEWCVRSAAWRGLNGWAPYGYVTLDAARGMDRVVALVWLAAREARCWVARTVSPRNPRPPPRAHRPPRSPTQGGWTRAPSGRAPRQSAPRS